MKKKVNTLDNNNHDELEEINIDEFEEIAGGLPNGGCSSIISNIENTSDSDQLKE